MGESIELQTFIIYYGTAIVSGAIVPRPGVSSSGNAVTETPVNHSNCDITHACESRAADRSQVSRLAGESLTRMKT